MTDPSESDDRRGFYRIDDKITLHLTSINEDERNRWSENLSAALSPELQTLNELRRLDNENLHVLRQIQDKSRDLAQLLRVQNQKIELLTQLLITQHSSGFDEKEVEISGGGLGFNSNQEMTIDSYWLLKIITQPDAFAFACVGKVISSSKASSGFDVGLEFVEIDSYDQDELFKHITKLQSRRLRKQRLGE